MASLVGVEKRIRKVEGRIPCQPLKERVLIILGTGLEVFH
jgi:hypothetical protein